MGMRRKDREVTGREAIEAILCQTPVCRLALNAQSGAPYLVPLCFGYEWLQGDRLRLVFHSAMEGRKLRLLRADPRVGFELDAGYELLPARTACRHSCRFASVIGTGTARLLTDDSEKRRAAALLMNHLAGARPPLEERALENVVFFEVVADELTAKQNI